MSLVADALQPHILQGFADLEGRSTGLPLADLIGKQGQIGFQMQFDNVNQRIEFDFFDRLPILRSYANDCGRFASSAFQSIVFAGAEADDGERVAWAIVKAYYAAFYAGHSVIRIFGRSCTYLDRHHVARIVALAQAQAQQYNFPISATVYRCTTEQGDTSKLNITRIRQGSGGAHEAFWDVFGSLVGSLGEKILSGPLSQTEAQLVFSKFEAARLNLASRSSPYHSWLSAIRNEVQYRHGHAVWMPCGLRKQDRETLGRVLSQWQTDPMSINVGSYPNKPLVDFATSCVFIVAMCRTLLIRIADRSPRKSRSFAQNGPLALLPKQVAAI